MDFFKEILNFLIMIKYEYDKLPISLQTIAFILTMITTLFITLKKIGQFFIGFFKICFFKHYKDLEYEKKKYYKHLYKIKYYEALENGNSKFIAKTKAEEAVLKAKQDALPDKSKET